MITRPRNLLKADPFLDSVVLLCPFSGEDGDTSSTDLSNNSLSLTFSGNAQLTGDKRKFGFTSLYSPATGTNSYVDSATDASLALGTGDFTIELWVRFEEVLTSSGYQGIFDQRPASVVNDTKPTLYISGVAGGTLNYYVSGANRIVGPVVSADTWYHIAVVRSSGTTKMFVNGSQVGSDYSDSTDYTEGRIRIGGLGDTTTLPARGWIENVRVTKGVARYSGAFTPPERAPSTIQNVNIIPGSGSSNIDPVDPGNLKILVKWEETYRTNPSRYRDQGTYDYEVAVSDGASRVADPKYGTYSVNTTGGGTSRAYMIESESGGDKQFNIGANTPFSIEAWVKFDVLPSVKGVNGTIASYYQSSGNRRGFVFNVQTANDRLFFLLSADGTNFITISGDAGTEITETGRWYHLAVCRDDSDDIRLFVDGAQVNAAPTNDGRALHNSSYPMWLGNTPLSTGGTNQLDGQIDEYRVIVGEAIYTASFTPPDQSHTDPINYLLEMAAIDQNKNFGSGYDASSLWVRNNGTYLLTVQDQSTDYAIESWTLSTPWTLSTLSGTPSSSLDTGTRRYRAVGMNTDGTKMIAHHTDAQTLYEYDLSTPYDLSTASQVDSLSFSANPMYGFWISNDGLTMYTVRPSTHEVKKYTFGTACDLSTISGVLQTLDLKTNVSSLIDDPMCVSFDTSGQHMFVADGTGSDNTVYEVYLSTPWDLSTATFTHNSFNTTHNTIYLPVQSRVVNNNSELWLVTNDAINRIDGIGLYNPNPSPIVQDGLILHLDAGNVSSYSGTGTIWSDLSGNGLDAVHTGTPDFIDGGVGGAFDFQADSNVFNVADDPLLNLGGSSSDRQFTMSVWIESTDLTTDTYIFSKLSNEYTMLLGYQNGNVNAFINGTYQPDATSTQMSISSGTWTHFAYTKGPNAESNNWKGYKNGVEQFSLSRSFGFDDSANSLNIGSAGGVAHYEGRLAIMQLYDRALTPAEIQQNFDAEKARFGL